MYFDELRSYISYRSGNPDLADDVVQQTFIRLWEKQITILPGKEKALLYKIAGDEFIDQIRKKKVSVEFSDDLFLVAGDVQPDERLEYEDSSRKLRKALRKMNESQRVVFLMSRRDGLRQWEIAERLNISVKAVEKRMNIALGILRVTFNSDEQRNRK